MGVENYAGGDELLIDLGTCGCPTSAKCRAIDIGRAEPIPQGIMGNAPFRPSCVAGNFLWHMGPAATKACAGAGRLKLGTH